MNKKHLQLAGGLLVCGALFFQGQVQAQETPTKPGFTGAVALSLISDDNIYKVEDNTEGDTILVLAPEIAHTSVFSKHRLDLGLNAALASYSDKDDENYTDSQLFADLLLDLTKKFNLGMGTNYTMGHDARGSTGAALIQSLEPDTWEQLTLYLDGVYGRRTSQAQIEVKVDHVGKDYTNNDQEARNRDTNTMYFTFFYNLTAKSSYLLELRSAGITYTDAPDDARDSTETSILVGTRWEITDLTTGELRLGSLNKDLNGDLDTQGNVLEDFSGFTVEGNMQWTPLEADRFFMGFTRQANESSQVTASYYIATIFNLDWQHEFSPIMGMNAGLRFEDDDYSDGRNDDVTNIYVGGNYNITQRFSLAANYQYASRVSSQDFVEYTANTIMLTGTYTPEW